MKIFLLSFFIVLVGFSKAQTQVALASENLKINKYTITLSVSVASNAQPTTDYIKRICAAEQVRFNASPEKFEVLTFRDLQYNIIEGKLQKNATPLSNLVLEGKIKYEPSAAATTNQTE